MKTITTGQKDQITTFVKDAARKATEEAIAELEASGALNGDNLQRIIEKGNHVSAEVKKFLKEMFAKLAESIVDCLKLISGAETLTLDPTDGAEMISKRSDIFDGYIDSDFKNYGCNIKSQSTDAMNVQVHEMVEDGTFEKIYSSQGRELDSMCLTQGQIISFVQKYRNWLRTDGYGTFFLFKVDSKFFVAFVCFASGLLFVRVLHLSYDGVWGAGRRRRFVLPQLTLGS